MKREIPFPLLFREHHDYHYIVEESGLVKFFTDEMYELADIAYLLDEAEAEDVRACLEVAKRTLDHQDIYDFFKAWSETDELSDDGLKLVEATVVK